MGDAIALAPARDVEKRGEDSFVAVSSEPWLTIEAPALLAAAGHFVEVTYRASYWDEPMRPVFRFHRDDGTSLDSIAAGPVAGAGVWIGRVPSGTIRISLSPTSREGRFSFRVETIRRRTWLGLVARGLRTNPRSARSAVLTRLIGWAPESDINLAWAIGSTPLADYPRWSEARARPVELAGLDTPRFAWTEACPIHLIVDARHGADGLDETLASLDAQVFAPWTACVLDHRPGPLSQKPRLTRGSAPTDLGDGGGDALVGVLCAGDILKPQALACIAEAAQRHPTCHLFYGDEEQATSAGLVPAFRPGWSPVLQAQQGPIGRGIFVRRSLLTAVEVAEAFVDRTSLPPSVLAALNKETVFTVRRVLLRTREAAHRSLQPVAAPQPSPQASSAVIIPTRDQPARLRRAIASIDRFSGPTRPTLVIVDNGSVEQDACDLLASLRQRDDVRVLERPGAFNFSAMCNDGAAAAGPVDVLVFLNDDTEILSAGWLERLAAWAMQPSIGAVGAKLTYPDGRLQHIGVVLGMGGSAGHFGSFAPSEASGWNGRHAAAHEVSAVTGACLALARTKFDAIGGFDAVDLPVELSDIDLCLKLADRGWCSLVDPAVHLRHDESASRGGATFRRTAVYHVQRAIFQRRWLSRLRDDPYFHPGLSLFKWEAALG